MKSSCLLTAVTIVFVVAAALAQAPSDYSTGEPFEYVNRDDCFAVNFPVEPTVEAFTYTSEYRTELPARRYTARQGDNTYSVTLVDFTSSTVAQPETRLRLERAGAVAHAATALRQRGEVTYDAYAEVGMIPGHSLQVTEPDGRRLYAQIVRHEQRLYILEASVPAGATPPIQFQLSLQILDENGDRISYSEEEAFAAID